MHPNKLFISITIFLLLAACNAPPSVTPSVVPSAVASALPGPIATGKLPLETSPTREQNLLPTTQPGRMAPYPDAPLCADSGAAHDNSLFHTLWDDIRGCHYDHEHGQNPFTPEVAAAFPGLDLQALIGGVGVGHTNPSSPMENTH